MKLLISIILIIVTVILNVILIILSNKYKNSNVNIKSKNISKSELITSLNKLLKKEIFIIAIGITLGFLVFFIENSNKIVSNVFFTLSILYSFICSILGIYNYNCFNNLLNKNSK